MRILGKQKNRNENAWPLPRLAQVAYQVASGVRSTHNNSPRGHSVSRCRFQNAAGWTREWVARRGQQTVTKVRRAAWATDSHLAGSLARAAWATDSQLSELAAECITPTQVADKRWLAKFTSEPSADHNWPHKQQQKHLKSEGATDTALRPSYARGKLTTFFARKKPAPTSLRRLETSESLEPLERSHMCAS